MRGRLPHCGTALLGHPRSLEPAPPPQTSGSLGEMAVPAAQGPPAEAVTVAVLSAPGPRQSVARELSEAVVEHLTRLQGIRPQVVVAEDVVLAQPAETVELVEALRDRLLREDWDLVVGITDLPLRLARRPVAGHASPTHGVAVLSLPALGAGRISHRARIAVGHLLDEVLGEAHHRGASEMRSARLQRRLTRLRDVGDEAGGLSGVLTGGYLRLLAGLVWANAPWRFAARLSRALVAALAAVVFALVTPDLWVLSAELGPVRLVVLTVASIVATTGTLMGVHHLWERPRSRRVRSQVALFNLATSATVLFGVMTLYAALFVVTAAAAALLLPSELLSDALGHRVGVPDYLLVAWLISSLATVGGGLGGGLESEASVREATYAADADDDAA